jgi:hypothetical protein
MSRKTLVVLVVLLAVLVGGMWISGRRAAAPAGKTAAGGGALLPAVALGTVQAIVLDDGASTTHLAKVDGIWCVAEQDNAPADVGRLRQMIQSLDGMKPGLVVDEGAGRLAEFGLAAGENGAPMQIVLEHGKGTTVLGLGKMREPQEGEQAWRQYPGRYARVDEGPVLLLADDIPMAQSDSGSWWDRTLLAISPESIRQVEVGSGASSFTIDRGTNGAFSLAGGAEGQEVDVAAANRLFGALRSLRAEQMLPGAEKNESEFINTVQYKAMAEGATYLVKVGEARSDNGGSRPVEIEVMAAADATPEQQAAVAAAVRKLGNRTFLIPAYLADALTPLQEVLLRTTEPPPAEPVKEPAPVETPATP